MTNDLTFSISTTRFDEDYTPSSTSRGTTNFANLARGEDRQQNLRNALGMINRRFNDLAHWDNPGKDRYAVQLDIVSVDLQIPEAAENGTEPFPLIEMLNTQILDTKKNALIDGIVGNNFSSYVRDYDFSVRLRAHAANGPQGSLPDDFGGLHGKLFTHFLDSDVYRQQFPQLPVICISVSSKQTYHRLENHHPILGVEYGQNEYSLTDQYFGKMGLEVRYFMPPGSAAPLAFYFSGDLLNDYSNLALISTISTMEAFQKIYRPEIYSANTPAAETYQPSLENSDYTPIEVSYDREERSQLGIQQGQFTEEHFMKPYGAALHQWAANYSL